MAITSNFAIRYSNEYVRPLGDALGKAYHFGRSLDQRWIALGENLPALTLLVGDFRKASEFIIRAYVLGFETNMYWVAGASALFPNTSEIVADSADGTSQDPSRPPLTGARVNTIITRRTEFANWLETGLFAGGGFDAGAQRNEFVKAQFGVGLNLNGAGVTTAALLATYIRQMRANYEASSNANLSTVLQVAVNPGSMT